jgi:hypothetical protein
MQLLNGIILLGTFGYSRLLWGTYQSTLIYMDIWTAWKSRGLFDSERSCGALPISSFTGLDPAVQCYEHPLPLVFVSIYLGGNTALTGLNFYWFRKMIIAVLKRFQPSVKTEGKPKRLDG